MSDSSDLSSAPPLIVLFDGTCGLCNSLVGFILKRDPHRRFRFASLQSAVGQELLIQHGLAPDDLNTMVVIENDRTYLRSNAVLRVAIELPDPWPLVGTLSFVPAFLRDDLYNFVATHRHQWFKKTDACRIPTPQEQEQFL